MCSWIRKIDVKMSISNLQTECNFYQNPNGIFYKNRKTNPKIHMEPQRNLNSQNNLEKEEKS